MSDPYSSFHAFLASSEIPLHPSIFLSPIPNMGTGLLTTTDLPAHTELFSIPKPVILSTQSSLLKTKLSTEEWEGLNGGWGRLILCLMWEEGRGADSPWRGYLDVLPREFSTPMFWSQAELEELKGTSIYGKIGIEEATKEYTDRLLPLIQAHPELFPPAKFDSCFSLEWFHIQGSRILSRSFHIEGPKDEDQEDDGLEEDEDEDDGGEDVDKVGMVPMADMLNARWGEENARLFYTETNLTMITTQPIPAGQQIYNTYAHPPNSDLLRRYGHVDIIPPSLVGNEEDEVEIRCDLVVEIVKQMLIAKGGWDEKEWDMDGRVEFWLEEGGDDIIAIQITSPLPPPLIAFLTLLLLPSEAYLTARGKGKLPRPKLSLQGAQVGKTILETRLADYPTTIERDLSLLSSPPADLPARTQLAIVVRAGEKAVLTESLRLLALEEAKLASAGDDAGEKKSSKRKATASGGKSGSSSKKSR